MLWIEVIEKCTLYFHRSRALSKIRNLKGFRLIQSFRESEGVLTADRDFFILRRGRGGDCDFVRFRADAFGGRAAFDFDELDRDLSSELLLFLRVFLVLFDLSTGEPGGEMALLRTCS